MRLIHRGAKNWASSTRTISYWGRAIFLLSMSLPEVLRNIAPILNLAAPGLLVSSYRSPHPLALFGVQAKPSPTPVDKQIISLVHRKLVFQPIDFSKSMRSVIWVPCKVFCQAVVNNPLPFSCRERFDPGRLFRPMVITPGVEGAPFNIFRQVSFQPGETLCISWLSGRLWVSTRKSCQGTDGKAGAAGKAKSAFFHCRPLR